MVKPIHPSGRDHQHVPTKKTDPARELLATADTTNGLGTHSIRNSTRASSSLGMRKLSHQVVKKGHSSSSITSIQKKIFGAIKVGTGTSHSSVEKKGSQKKHNPKNR